MSGPDTGGPPSGPKATGRLTALFDRVADRVLAQMQPITQLTRGDVMRGNPDTNPHPQPSSPGTPPPPKLRH